MAYHLKFRDGHLTFTASGHLAYCPGAVNTCNTCDPALRDTYYVTIEGMTGAWAGWNGKHACEWVVGCKWWSANPWESPGIEMEYPPTWAGMGDDWAILVEDPDVVGNGAAFESGEDTPCDPTGQTFTYTKCSTGGDCSEAVNATMVVSLT